MKKVLLRILLVVGVIIIAFVGLAAWYTWEGDDSEIRARADAIQVPNSWQLMSEKVVPPIRLCLEKSGCPSIERTWKLDRVYTKDELQEIVSSLGVYFEANSEECVLSGYAHGSSISVCSFMSSSDGYWYYISQSANDTATTYNLSIHIREE
jgi:hypothetical protein